MSVFSLRARLLLSTTFTLAAFLGLAGLGLDRAFIASARVTVKNQLITQFNTLLTVMEVDEAGNVLIGERLPESELSLPNSGLYAGVIDEQGSILWRSRSALGIDLDFLVPSLPGVETFFQEEGGLAAPFYYSFGINWETGPGRGVDLTLVIYNESDAFRQTVQSHRRILTFWLGLAGLFLLVVQALTVRWGLSPLRQVAREIDLIERTGQNQIVGEYPAEIAQLSQRINQFIDSERNNRVRYRNILGDLAHSLKTPLTVLRSYSDSATPLDRKQVDELVDRMTGIIEYQLKRASSVRQVVMNHAVDVACVIGKLGASLQKVYAEKNPGFTMDVDDGARFVGDEGDLFELLGNVLDNAFKWADRRVLITGRKVPGKRGLPDSLCLEIHDDGPGVAQSERKRIMERGVRADQQIPGQGIGLAVVREIVGRYDGSVYIGDSELGGARFVIDFSAVPEQSQSSTR